MNLSRRQVLKMGTAAGMAAAMPRLWAGAPRQLDALGGFHLGVQSYTFRKFTTEQALKRTRDLGLRYIEFANGHVRTDMTPEQIKALLKLCNEYDITPNAFGVQHFSRDHEANKKVFEFAKAMGLKSLSANPDVDSFDSLDRLVEAYKIPIAIHPHGPAGRGKLDHWYCADVILAAVKDHHPLIGTCIDTGHIIRAEILGKKLDPAEEIRKMGARNFGIHLKDNDNEREKAGKRDSNVVLGQGVLNVREVIKALRDVKFDGPLSIEYESKEEEPSPDVRACINVFKKAISNEVGA